MTSGASLQQKPGKTLRPAPPNRSSSSSRRSTAFACSILFQSGAKEYRSIRSMTTITSLTALFSRKFLLDFGCKPSSQRINIQVRPPLDHDANQWLGAGGTQQYTAFSP